METSTLHSSHQEATTKYSRQVCSLLKILPSQLQSGSTHSETHKSVIAALISYYMKYLARANFINKRGSCISVVEAQNSDTCNGTW